MTSPATICREAQAATCSSPLKDERLDVAVAGPRLLLGEPGVDLDAFGPDLVALAGGDEAGRGVS